MVSVDKIMLGNKVKDKITGFVGIVVSEHHYLNGCVRYSVQPTELKDGKMLNVVSFDSPRLETIEVGVATIGDTKACGPNKYEDKGI